MLTGRPEEEMPGSAGDLLQDLSQLHERVRQVMQGIAQALWPSASLPGGMGELVEILKGARRRFHRQAEAQRGGLCSDDIGGCTGFDGDMEAGPAGGCACHP